MVKWIASFTMLLVVGCNQVGAPRNPASTTFKSRSSFSHDTFEVRSMDCQVCHEKKRPIETPIHGNGNDCKSCHTVGGPWAIATGFGHNPVPSSCKQCHGAGAANNHVPSGHLTIDIAQDCLSCHQGVVAGGFKSRNDWQLGVQYVHPQEVLNGESCSSCHGLNKAYDSITSLKPDHRAMGSLDCKACHIASIQMNGLMNSWVGGNFDHANRVGTGSCLNCHGDTNDFDSFPEATHIAVGGTDCNSCHQATIIGNYQDWTGASMDHLGLLPSTRCDSCHGNGNFRDSFPEATHVAVGNTDCKSCHQASQTNGYTSWVGAVMAHTNLHSATRCDSCHGTGGSKPSFPTTHFNVGTTDCKTCHQASQATYTDWKNGSMDHTNVSETTRCDSCHGNSGFKDSFPDTHIAVGGVDCRSCHQASLSNSYTNWLGGKMDHSTVGTTTRCDSCHGSGGVKPSFPAEHIIVGTTDCKTCHFNSTSNGYINWTNAVMDHGTLATTARCDSCHGKTQIKDSFPATHINVGSTDCKSCHQSSITNGYLNWTNGSMDHNTLVASTRCDSCHGNSGSVDSFPSTHFDVGTTDCKTCHQASVSINYGNWLNGKMDHAGVVSTQRCDSCHGDTGFHDSYPANHLNVGMADCKSCHLASMNTYTAWTGATMDHTALPSTMTCESCHGDGQVRDSFPSDHIGVGSTDCKSCHQSTINNGYLNWQGGVFDHTASLIAQKNCASCHSQDEPMLNGKPFGRLMQQDPNLAKDHSHYGQTDCFYCHRPNTSQGWKTWFNGSNFLGKGNSHKDAQGNFVVGCMPCHYSTTDPRPDTTGQGRISEHSNLRGTIRGESQRAFFRAPAYDMDNPSTDITTTGHMGKCAACHRTSF